MFKSLRKIWNLFQERNSLGWLTEQRIRGVLFYISLFVFLIGLPFILSYALGYKFNPRTFKFTKTGIVVLKTEPAGAKVYVDNHLFKEKTPTNILELLPGQYLIRLEMDRYFSWTAEVPVNAGKVTRLEKIILFPVRPMVKQINKEKFDQYLVDAERNIIYLFGLEEGAIYKSDFEGEHFQKIGEFVRLGSIPLKWKISSDRQKLLYFNSSKIAVAYLDYQKGQNWHKTSFILDYPKDNKIVDAFWHADNYHIILVTNSDIEVVEEAGSTIPVVLTTLTKRNSSAFYDSGSNALYFTDYQVASDGAIYDNMYKLELNNRFSALRGLMNLTPAFERGNLKYDERE